MTEQAENLREGDVFLLAGNRCTAEHIIREENTTWIVFSFLDTPDYGGAFVCRSDTAYRVLDFSDVQNAIKKETSND